MKVSGKGAAGNDSHDMAELDKLLNVRRDVYILSFPETVNPRQ